MKNQNVERKELFTAFFEDKDFTKEQLEMAKQSVRKPNFSKTQKDKINNIKKLQHRLNNRKNELLSKALGIENLSKDKEIKELVDDLKKNYAGFNKESIEYNLSLNDCPKLPPLEDFMSRFHPNPDNDFLPLLNAHNNTHTTGTDDNFFGADDPDSAVANADKARFQVSANSISDHPLSENSPVQARASLIFPLKTRYSIQYSNLIIKAHLFGGYKGSQFGFGLVAGPSKIRAWIKMSIQEIWNEYLIPRDSVTVNLMNEKGGSIPYTPFQRTLKLNSNHRYGPFPNPLFQVSITAGVEALAPSNVSSILFPQNDIGVANAALDMVLCAIDIGYEPEVIKLPDDRKEIPEFPIEFL